MLAMSFLQEGPNTSLVWLFYVLLAFLLLVVVVGALTSHEKTESFAPKPGEKPEELALKSKQPGRAKRQASRKKSK